MRSSTLDALRNQFFIIILWAYHNRNYVKLLVPFNGPQQLQSFNLIFI